MPSRPATTIPPCILSNRDGPLVCGAVGALTNSSRTTSLRRYLEDRRPDRVVVDDGEARMRLEPECIASPDCHASAQPLARDFDHAVREECRHGRQAPRANPVVEWPERRQHQLHAVPGTLLDGVPRQTSACLAQA